MTVRSSLADQLAAADGPRILIVGAGVAGLTLAQLLRRDGIHPVLVERAAPGRDVGGYMLGLMPFVDPVIAALGAESGYLERSVGMHRYRLRGRTGRPLREYPLDDAIGRFGRFRGIERAALLDVIAAAGAPVAFSTTVTAVDQRADAVRVRIDEAGASVVDGFDAVVIADGLHSRTRDLAFGTGHARTFDTGWGGWVAWAGEGADTGSYDETWGAGFFVGLYPVPGRTGVFLGGPRAEAGDGPSPFLQRHAGVDARVADAVAAADHPYFWPMTDTRSPTWVSQRVVLLGDAAAGFLPTAGVGASMAMESAAVLARRIAGGDRARLPERLRDFERAQRPRVERAQNNSRQLARLMFRRGRLVTGLRDAATRFAGVDSALGPIIRLLRERPDLEP